MKRQKPIKKSRLLLAAVIAVLVAIGLLATLLVAKNSQPPLPTAPHLAAYGLPTSARLEGTLSIDFGPATFSAPATVLYPATEDALYLQIDGLTSVIDDYFAALGLDLRTLLSESGGRLPSLADLYATASDAEGTWWRLTSADLAELNNLSIRQSSDGRLASATVKFHSSTLTLAPTFTPVSAPATWRSIDKISNL